MEATGCGFAISFVVKKIKDVGIVGRSNPSAAIDTIHQSYSDVFGTFPLLDLKRDTFKKNYQRWRKKCCSWSNNMDAKNRYLDAFPIESWNNLPRNSKEMHSFNLI